MVSYASIEPRVATLIGALASRVAGEVTMAGPEGEAETLARAQLAAMAPRLGEAPHALLGVPVDASPEMLRAAFLRLTKQYHPTRYARFSPDVVRLANEVFLTIKRAYDQLHAPKQVAAGTGSVASRPAGSTAPPRAGTPSPQPPRAAAPTPAPAPAPSRAVTASAVSTPRAPTAPVATPPRAPIPSRGRAETPPTGTPKVSFTAPDPRARTGSIDPPTAQPQPQLQPARTRASSAPPPTRALTADEQALEPAMELMRRKLWSEARQALLKLAVAAPQDKRYRAWMHYARGRESQEAGKTEEARSEWGRALGLDPELAAARRALDELPAAPAGGLLGRLFGKK